MSEDATLSGTPEGGSEQAAIDRPGGAPPADEAAASEPIAAEATTSVSAPVSMFRPTMHDGSSASETRGATAPDRPLETQPDGPAAGEIAPCDGPDAAADQALILGAPDGSGTEGASVAEAADGTAAPGLAADLIDGTNLFGDRAATWSGDPSEVGAGYGVDPSHAEICLCDEASLTSGRQVPELAPELAS